MDEQIDSKQYKRTVRRLRNARFDCINCGLTREDGNYWASVEYREITPEENQQCPRCRSTNIKFS